jgi:hypothetical protein
MNTSVITEIRGTADSIIVVFTNDDGTFFNLTDYTLFFTVKNNNDTTPDNDDLAVIKKDVTVHTDPTNGKSTITLTNEDTNILPGDYVWDIKLVSVGGDVTATMAGIFTISDSVTKRCV